MCGCLSEASDLRLAFEAGDAVRVGFERLRQNLDGDIAAEPCIARAIDLAHAAGANQLDDFIRPEAAPDHRCGSGVADQLRGLGQSAFVEGVSA